MLRLSRAAAVSRDKQATQATFLPLLLLIILLSGVGCVVVYQVRFIATKNGRTDYALAGESLELSCHYIMKDEAEDVKQLVWSKDGKNFLRWRKHKPGLEVLSYTFKGHVDPLSKHSHITLHNVTIDMHGKYKCSVKTDLGTHEMEQDLVVISQSNCKLNDWRVTSQPSECRELFRLDCRNMFPKPVPSCGLWNGRLEKFIRSVMVDISEEPNRQTYRVRYADKFELKKSDGTINPMHADLLQYAGHLMFKCDISVPETSWKLSLVHRMFDFEDGCLQDPLDTIERMRSNYSHYATTRMQQAGYLVDRQLDDFEMLSSSLEYELVAPIGPIGGSSSNNKLDLNCWQKPRHGTLARLSCATKGNQAKLVGANLLECQPTGWMPILEKPKPSTKKLIPRRPPAPRSNRRVAVAQETGSKSELERVNLDEDNNDDDSRKLGIQQENSNDLEEETRTTTTTSSITTTTMLSTEVKLIPTTTTPSEHLHPSSRQPNRAQNQFSSLTPGQLASLLPSCISNRRHVHPTTSVVVTNRLPLLDLEESRARASSSNERQPPKRDRSSSLSIFNFSTSSSCSRLYEAPILMQIAFTSLLMIMVLYFTSIRLQHYSCYLSCRY